MLNKYIYVYKLKLTKSSSMFLNYSIILCFIYHRNINIISSLQKIIYYIISLKFKQKKNKINVKA